MTKSTDTVQLMSHENRQYWCLSLIESIFNGANVESGAESANLSLVTLAITQKLSHDQPIALWRWSFASTSLLINPQYPLFAIEHLSSCNPTVRRCVVACARYENQLCITPRTTVFSFLNLVALNPSPRSRVSPSNRSADKTGARVMAPSPVRRSAAKTHLARARSLLPAVQMAMANEFKKASLHHVLIVRGLTP